MISYGESKGKSCSFALFTVHSDCALIPLNNLADDSRFAGERSRLEKKMTELRKAFNDPTDFETLHMAPSERAQPKNVKE